MHVILCIEVIDMGLKELRISRNIKQEELAEHIGVSPSMISSYERGLSIPSAETIIAMADFFNTTTDEILAGVRSAQIPTEEKYNRIAYIPPITNKAFAKFYDDEDRIFYQYWVVDNARKRANGHCEFCGNPAPFERDDGSPYLVFSFIQPFRKGGRCTEDNIISLCPNCNARVKTISSPDQVEYIRSLLKSKIK